MGSQEALSRCIRPLPSAYSKRRLRTALAKWTDWFYEFDFQDGVSTQTDPVVNEIHRTRAEMILPFLDGQFGDRWPDVRCLDVASHQGWFAMQVALRGAREVRGIDIRESHVERASAIGEITGLQNIRFERRNLYEVDAEQDGVFDLTLFLGVLYHLDNPLEALRTVRSVTKQLCVLETQVARSAPPLSCLWGSSPGLREGPAMAVIPSDEGHVEGDRSVVLVPTLEALYQVLYAVGFDRLYLCVPPQSAYEQYANLDRVVVFASVT